MTGIADSLIAAILYSSGRKIWTKLNDPVANAIDKTITHFSKEKGVEIERKNFAALLEGSIGEDEINRFKEGERFIDGEKLARQFAILGDFYFEDKSETQKVAKEVFAYFRNALTRELLKDPQSSIQTLWSIQNIALNISQEEHKKILEEIKRLSLQERPVFSIGEQKVEGDLYQAETIYIQKPEEKRRVKTKQLKLVIDNLEVEQFDSSYRRLLCFGIAGFLGIDPSDVKIVNVEKGSIKVTVEVPENLVGPINKAVRERSPEFEDAMKPLLVVRVETVEGTPPPEDKVQVNARDVWSIGGFVVLAFVVVLGAITCASRFGDGFWSFMAAVVGSFIVLTVLAIIGRFMGVFGEGTVTKFLDAALAALHVGIRKVKQEVGTVDKSPVVGYAERVEIHYDEKERGAEEAKEEKVAFPLPPSLHNQTPPEVNFVGRKEYLKIITDWYKSDRVRIGALIGWGGVGKSALVRKWYDSLEENKIQPDGIFWWGFYRNAYLEQFLNALLRYISGGQIEPDTIKGTWEKVERIKEYINQGAYLIVLDGLEQMQKSESGDEFGKMNHREFTELLHYLVDVPEAKGLCLITTRFTLKDLDDWETRGYENQPLIDLSIVDALLMLEKRGVKGSDDDMTEIIKKYKGHALSLTSLAGYLTRYYDGDIEQAPDIKFVLGDEERFKDVNKLLQKYAEKMSKTERVFLNIFSLFRQDVTIRDFDGVFRHKIKGTRFNDVLVKMSKLDFKDLIEGLVEWRLIWYDQAKKSYSTHPLIKTYFESDFGQKDKKLSHKRIYEYFGEDAPERPETLEQMQPLFEQVYHGCAAGLYDEVHDDIYWKKIGGQPSGYEITHKLGAEETDLSLVRNFFPEGNLSQMPLVSERSKQSWLLNEAGLALLVTGRPKEAEEPSLTAIKMAIGAEDWKNASAGYQNLASLQFRTGEIESGLSSSQKALDFAEKAKYEFCIWASKGYFGWSLYLSGKSEEAKKMFRQADEFCIKVEGNRLRCAAGVFYADFLISMKKIDDALELTRQNIEVCQRNNWPADVSRCHRCLSAIERIRGNYEKAEEHLEKALEIGRRVAVPDLEIEALIEQGRLCLDMGEEKEAIGDANHILTICGRTGFKFYEPDAEIILAKANLAQKNYDEAEKYAKSAYEKAVSMKYRWVEGDAGHLLGQIYIASGEKTKARKQLQKAVACRKEIKDPKVKETQSILDTRF